MMMGCDKNSEPVAGGLTHHIPVMLREVIDALAPSEGDVYVDATFGSGGYSRAALEAAPCIVVGLDRDPVALDRGAELATAYPGRLILRQSHFSALADQARAAGFAKVQGVMMDIGVSSMQLDAPERGFSFMRDGPLDMRMDGDGMNAADLVNALPEKDLAAIIWWFGEERRARAIAKAIVRARTERPLTSTAQLARIVSSVLGHRPGKHPATRTFQALRIAVNDELEELASALFAAEDILDDGGRLIVVSFHSLEERIVKRFFANARGGQAPSRYLPQPELSSATFKVEARQPVQPSTTEIADNPRARSARMRVGYRTPAQARPMGDGWRVDLGAPDFALAPIKARAAQLLRGHRHD